MSGLEKKAGLILDAKFEGEGNGYLVGYASVKNNVDAYGDVIVDGAYKNLDLLVGMGFSGFNHDDCVGYIESAVEDSKGLLVKIVFHSTQEAQDVRTIIQERMAAGKTCGMSIMYRTIDAAWETRDGVEVRVLSKIEVVEAGFVLLPANQAASVTQVKGGTGTPLAEQWKSVQDAATDFLSRFEAFKSDRKQGLSEKHVEMIEDVAQRVDGIKAVCDALLAEDEPATTQATDEELAALAARMKSLEVA